jgi:hypothetical protein
MFPTHILIEWLDRHDHFTNAEACRRFGVTDVSPLTSYRVSRHCDGTAENSDEKQVTVAHCKAKTKAREQEKSDQLP